MPIANLILAALMLVSVFSCSVRVEPEALVFEDGLSLVFSCDDDFLVKSEDKAGVDTLNENLLSSVEFFMYPIGGTNSDAVLHGYLTGVRKDAPYSVSVTEDILNSRLCPNNAKYFCLYAIANHSRLIPAVAQGEFEDLSGTSVPQLEALTRDLDMANGGGVMTKQTNFLMSTDGVVQSSQVKRHQTTVATVNVNLKRVAAKLSVYVRVPEFATFESTVVINGVEDTRTEVWRPRTDEMTIYLVNGAKTGQVSGAPLASSDLFEYQPLSFDMNAGKSHSYFTYNQVPTGQYDEDGEELIDYQPVELTGTFNPSYYPFYTYPESWEFGSDTEPYLKLMIPWDRDPGTSTGGRAYGTLSRQYYYRVYCPGSAVDGTHAQFLRNNWYEIFLNVSILGSELEGAATVIPGSYYVVDWQEREDDPGSGGSSGTHDTDKEAEIKGARYLFVNDTEYTLYNVDDLMIPYVTSDPCEIVSATAYRWDFSGDTKQQQSTTNLESWGITLELQTTATGAHIHFNRTIDNDLSGGNYDVSEYKIVFTLRQKDATTYSKDITIKQNPAIMIDLNQNSDTGKTHYGYAYVNGASGANNPYYYTYGSSLYGRYANASGTVRDRSGNGYKLLNYYLGSAPGSGNSSNTNYNMVVIETTVLPADSPYMLGDPRKMTVDNMNNTDWPSNASNAAASAWSMSSPSVQGTNRYMSNYYPTNPDVSANNIIAPKFRIASSWGATQPMRYADAFRRCASYQEDGYPAGRWRVPTVAEIQYIAQLNADGKITRLLGAKSTTGTNGQTTNYWCNSGYMVVYNGENSDWPQNGNRIPAPSIGTDNPDATTDGSTYYVRCVYDDWYWDGMMLGETDVTTVTPLNTFKWGDIPR